MHIHHDHISAGHTHSPREELAALMNYMLSHNAAHTRELADLARQLRDAGNDEACDLVMAAVADFERGNEHLHTALHALEG